MKEKFNIILFCALLLALGVLIVFVPADERVEELEHRKLNKLPALNLQTALNGEFSKQFEGFITDQVGYRTDLIMFSKNIENAYGVEIKDAPVVVITGDRQVNPGERPNEQPVQWDGRDPGALSTPAANEAVGSKDDDSGELAESDDDAEPGEPEEDDELGSGQSGLYDSQDDIYTPMRDVEPIQAGPVLAFSDRLMELYGYLSSACIRYAEVVESYAKALEGKARVFSIIPPTAIEFVDDRYKTLSDSEYNAIQIVYSRLELAIPVDSYSVMQAHSDEYIYFRTDHHWTALGAYYTYYAYCTAAGITPVTIDNYDSYRIPGFLGYLYSVHPTAELKNNPDTIVYYELKEPLETSNKLIYKPGEGGGTTYSIFIGGDRDKYEIKTSVGNGRTCIILKDSYGNAFVPWLAPNYETIIVIDPRHFSGSTVNIALQYDDVDFIIMNNVFIPGSGGMNSALEKIR